MIRRILWLVVTLLFVPLQLAQAQQPKKLSSIGILESGSPTSASERIQAFRQGLRELDYVEGQISASSTATPRAVRIYLPTSLPSWPGSK